MTKVTENEKAVLKNIMINEYNSWNWSEPPRDATRISTWVDCLDMGKEKIPSGKALSGVVSSLSQKGLVWTDGEAIELTDEGIEMYWNYIKLVDAIEEVEEWISTYLNTANSSEKAQVDVNQVLEERCNKICKDYNMTREELDAFIGER